MILYKKIQLQFLLLCIAFCFSAQLHAIETHSPNFKLNGFATLGLTKSSDDELGFREMVNQEGVYDEYDIGQNSDLGIQANYYATDKLDFALQLLAKKWGENTFDKTIQWAYLNYNFNAKFNIKLGRVSTASYLMSDFRHVGFTHLWAHLPLEFYGVQAISATDGINLVYKQPLFDGLVRTKLSFGKSNHEFYSNEVAETSLDKLFGVSVSWENDTWNLSLTYSQAESGLKNNTLQPLEQALYNASLAGWPDAANYTNLSLDNKTAHYYAAGVGYDSTNWLIQSEIAVIDADSVLTPGTMSTYLSIGRKLGSVTPFIMGAWVKALDDRLIIAPPAIAAYNPLHQISQYVFNQFDISQHTFSVGARWDVQPKVAVKAQWDRTWVDAYGGLLLTNHNGVIAEKKQLDVFSLSVDFLF